jgi:hypothetical protein
MSLYTSCIFLSDRFLVAGEIVYMTFEPGRGSGYILYVVKLYGVLNRESKNQHAIRTSQSQSFNGAAAVSLLLEVDEHRSRFPSFRCLPFQFVAFHSFSLSSIRCLVLVIPSYISCSSACDFVSYISCSSACDFVPYIPCSSACDYWALPSSI